MDNQLTVVESVSLSPGLTLEECERDIELADQIEELAYYIKGKRLEKIRDEGWYKSYGNWDDYCRQRWNLSGTHASKLIQIAQVIENIKKKATAVNILPATQRQARPLIGLNPEQQVEAWEKAVNTAPRSGVPGVSVTQEKKISGRHVQETVDRLFGTNSQQKIEIEQSQLKTQTISENKVTAPAPIVSEEETEDDISSPVIPFKDMVHNKFIWNLQRLNLIEFDHFTIGYSGRSFEQLIEVLKIAKVKVLVDVRDYPYSRYRPEFSKNNLIENVPANGIEYLHWQNLGVPQNIRDLPNRQDLFDWYDKNVLPGQLADLKLERCAFMCTEVDPQSCHRHKIAEYLERKGYRMLDL